MENDGRKNIQTQNQSVELLNGSVVLVASHALWYALLLVVMGC
jgi:hypothetical protein